MNTWIIYAPPKLFMDSTNMLLLSYLQPLKINPYLQMDCIRNIPTRLVYIFSVRELVSVTVMGAIFYHWADDWGRLLLSLIIFIIWKTWCFYCMWTMVVLIDFSSFLLAVSAESPFQDLNIACLISASHVYLTVTKDYVW